MISTSVILLPIVIIVVLALVGLVAYMIKSAKGARGAMDEGRRLQEEMERDVAGEDPQSDQTKEE